MIYHLTWRIGEENKGIVDLPIELHKIILFPLDLNSKLELKLVCKYLMKIIDKWIRVSFTFNRDDWDEYMESGRDLYFQHKFSVSRLDRLMFVDVDFVGTEDKANRMIQALTELLNSTIRLKSIDFRGCQGLKGGVVTCLPQSLQKLALCLLFDVKEEFTNDTLKILNERTKNRLSELVLDSFETITADGMKHIGTNITRLALYSMASITKEGLRHLPSSLISLSLDRLPINFFLPCHLWANLESLSIVSTRVKDEGLQAIGARLTSLVIKDSIHITDDGLDSLVGRLRHLEIYDFVQRGNITYKTVSRATQLHSLNVNSHLAVEANLSQQLTRLVLNYTRAQDKWTKPLPESLRELEIAR